MSEVIMTVVVASVYIAFLVGFVFFTLDDRRMDREWRALFDDDAPDCDYPTPDYGAIYQAMPVGEGERFATEEAKQAFLYGMRRAAGHVQAIDAELAQKYGRGGR